MALIFGQGSILGRHVPEIHSQGMVLMPFERKEIPYTMEEYPMTLPPMPLMSQSSDKNKLKNYPKSQTDSWENQATMEQQIDSQDLLKADQFKELKESNLSQPLDLQPSESFIP